MPIHTIQVSEYECGHCGWKWINRANGKDGPVPLKCAKCKRLNWNNPFDDVIGHTERGLRVRLANLEPDESNPRYRLGRNIQSPNELCKRFLNLKPRPTEKELIQALEPLGYNVQEKGGLSPIPDKPGWFRRVGKEWLRLKKQEIIKRREFMQQVIDSRSSPKNRMKR
jgi:hypothetical protein